MNIWPSKNIIEREMRELERIKEASSRGAMQNSNFQDFCISGSKGCLNCSPLYSARSALKFLALLESRFQLELKQQNSLILTSTKKMEHLERPLLKL